MAKVGLTKLDLKKNTEIEIIKFNEQEIEVKQYLPIEEKLDLIANIVNDSVDDNGYYNPAKVYIFTIIRMVEAYSNLNITEKQKEDIFKLYDLFAGSGLSAAIFQAINPMEVQQTQRWIAELIDSIYQYKNSLVGIFDAIKDDYVDLEETASELQETIGDKDNLTLLKDILTKLG